VINLIGQAESKLDTKGRFLFPAKYKGQLKELVNEGFVLKRSIYKKCLELFTMEGWKSESAILNKLNLFKRKNAIFVTKFMAGVRLVELDNAGRLLVSKDLMQYGGLSKNIVLTSVKNKIEIWDKEAYEIFVAFETEQEQEDLANLAEEVLGNFDNE